MCTLRHTLWLVDMIPTAPRAKRFVNLDGQTSKICQGSISEPHGLRMPDFLSIPTLIPQEGRIFLAIPRSGDQVSGQRDDPRFDLQGGGRKSAPEKIGSVSVWCPHITSGA